MNKEDFLKFEQQVWATRVSRVNAEKRLIIKEKYFQAINIYYSCVTIIFSILSLIKHDDDLSLMTVFMSISLLIVILYLNSQKYLEHAREYRKNYTEIQKLEFKLKHIDENNKDEIQKIENFYCDLLDSSSNHISFDFYRTVYESSGEYRKKRWKQVRVKYYYGVIWRFCVATFIIILPAFLFFFFGGN